MLSVNGDVITLTRGDSAALTVEIFTEDESGNRTLRETDPGDTLRLSVKRHPEDPVFVFQKTVVGESTVTVDPIDTKYLPPMRYFYDVELCTPSGDVYTVVGPAPLILEEDVT